MKPLVILGNLPFYKVIISKVSSHYNSKNILSFDKSNLTSVSKLATRSMFAVNYLVILYVDRKIESDVKSSFTEFLDFTLSRSWLSVIVMAEYQDSYNKWIEYFMKRKVEILTFDSYSTDNESRIEYVSSELYRLSDSKTQISSKTAAHILYRARYSLGKLDNYLQLLSRTDCTYSIINKIIPIKYHIKLRNIPISIYHGDNLNEIKRIILDYRYSPKYLIEPVKKFTENLFLVYKQYLNGSFTRYTYLQWVTDYGSTYEIKSEYTAVRYLEILERISFDKFLFIRNYVNSISISNAYLCTLKLIRLVDLCNA
jgi:hypothetical protein